MGKEKILGNESKKAPEKFQTREVKEEKDKSKWLKTAFIGLGSLFASYLATQEDLEKVFTGEKEPIRPKFKTEEFSPVSVVSEEKGGDKDFQGIPERAEERCLNNLKSFMVGPEKKKEAMVGLNDALKLFNYLPGENGDFVLYIPGREGGVFNLSADKIPFLAEAVLNDKESNDKDFHSFFEKAIRDNGVRVDVEKREEKKDDAELFEQIDKLSSFDSLQSFRDITEKEDLGGIDFNEVKAATEAEMLAAGYPEQKKESVLKTIGEFERRRGIVENIKSIFESGGDLFKDMFGVLASDPVRLEFGPITIHMVCSDRDFDTAFAAEGAEPKESVLGFFNTNSSVVCVERESQGDAELESTKTHEETHSIKNFFDDAVEKSFISLEVNDEIIEEETKKFLESKSSKDKKESLSRIVESAMENNDENIKNEIFAFLSEYKKEGEQGVDAKNLEESLSPYNFFGREIEDIEVLFFKKYGVGKYKESFDKFKQKFEEETKKRLHEAMIVLNNYLEGHRFKETAMIFFGDTPMKDWLSKVEKDIIFKSREPVLEGAGKEPRTEIESLK